jgi:hypothetical protein
MAVHVPPTGAREGSDSNPRAGLPSVGWGWAVGGWTRGALSPCTGVRPCERPLLQLPHDGHLTPHLLGAVGWGAGQTVVWMSASCVVPPRPRLCCISPRWAGSRSVCRPSHAGLDAACASKLRRRRWSEALR